MMVLERWMVAAIVVVGLVSTAHGQSTPPPASHHAKNKTKSNVVQPDSGAPPEQAAQPDASAPLAETPNYDPPPPPPRPPDPDPPVVAQPAPQPVQETPVVQKAAEPPPAPLRPMTAQEQQLEIDSTRLLTLVRELKEEVAKAGIDTLSLSALRKAEEIQRLSKNLKDYLKLQAVTSSGQSNSGAQ